MRKFPLFPPKRYSGEIKLSLPDFFYAEPGGPPLREYKQSMAEHEASPHPDPIKKKFFEIILIVMDLRVKKCGPKQASN